MKIDMDRALEAFANHDPQNPKCQECGTPLVLGNLCQDCKDEMEGRLSERQRFHQEQAELEKERYEENLGK